MILPRMHPWPERAAEVVLLSSSAGQRQLIAELSVSIRSFFWPSHNHSGAEHTARVPMVTKEISPERRGHGDSRLELFVGRLT